MALFEAILGGLLDFGTASATNKANRENTNALIADQRASREEGLQALTGTSDFSTTTRNAEGGFDVSQLGGADAATTRANLASGDIDRSLQLNTATANQQPTIGTLADARGIIERDNALQQSNFDIGLDKILIGNTRKFGGIGNTGEDTNAIDAISRFTDANRFGGETEAINLFQGAGIRDQELLRAILANLQPQAGAPAFGGGAPGTPAAQLIAQTPTHAPSVDASGAIPFDVAGGVLDQLRQAAADEQKRKDDEAFRNRQIGDQPVKAVG